MTIQVRIVTQTTTTVPTSDQGVQFTPECSTHTFKETARVPAKLTLRTQSSGESHRNRAEFDLRKTQIAYCKNFIPGSGDSDETDSDYDSSDDESDSGDDDSNAIEVTDVDDTDVIEEAPDDSARRRDAEEACKKT